MPPQPKDITGNGRWDPEEPAPDTTHAVMRAARLVALMAAALLEQRTRENLTRRQQAQNLGLSEGTLRGIEDGTTWPSLWVWTTFAEEYGFELPIGSEPLLTATPPDEELAVDKPAHLLDRPKIEFPLTEMDVRRRLQQEERWKTDQQLRVREFVETHVRALILGEFDIFSDPELGRPEWLHPQGVRTDDLTAAVLVELPVPWATYAELWDMSPEQLDEMYAKGALIEHHKQFEVVEANSEDDS